jgi:pyridoxal phosphate enzyme (YggS family)
LDVSASSVAQRLKTIRERIAQACSAADRNPDEIVLVGASKRQPLDRLVAAYEAGLRCFGENIVQEALSHREELPPDIEWHLIGPLQSNKANKAAGTFSWIHSIDRPKIAHALERAAQRQELHLHGLLEVNLGGESTKHGFEPESLSSDVAGLADLEHLRIEGLMAIPPYEPDAEKARSWFRRLRELRDDLFSRAEWSNRPGFLSMGMSADYPLAVEEGATHVRVGTNLFGTRDFR